MSAARPVGVLVMAHGTPRTPEEIEAFYTRIRRGRPPSPEQLAELVGRYAAIGGTSPLAARTAAQVEGLAALLRHDAPGAYVVHFGAKHTDPSIEDAAAALADAGVARLVALVLTPHHSVVGTGEYLGRAAAAAGGLPMTAVAQWYDDPGFVALMAERVGAARGALGAGGAVGPVVFTAHSVPARTVADDPRYPIQVGESADLVAAAAGVADYSVAWQSAGRTPEPWIGPALDDELRRRAAAGDRAVVVCPIGFVADHLEVLYDLDIEARAVAQGLGLAFARTASLNDDPRFLRVLADQVERAAAAAAPTGGGAP